MIIKKHIILLLSMTFLFTSCDQNAYHYLKIVNDLDSNEIKVDAWINYTFPSTVFSTGVPTHSSVITEKISTGIHGANDIYTDTLYLLDSINIYKIDGTTLIKSNTNFKIRSEWNYQQNGKDEGIYILTIDSTDF